MRKIIDKILGQTRVLVMENHRALHLHKGEIKGILLPGEHKLANRRDGLTIDMHSLAQPEFVSRYEKALFTKLPDVAEDHLTVFRTGPNEVAIIEQDKQVFTVLGPDRKMTVWTDAGPWTQKIINVAENMMIEPSLMHRLGAARKLEYASMITVGDGQAALLFIDGAFDRLLKAGVHGFWTPGRIVQQRFVDIKRQSLDVAGQELLTRDRVTIRINVTAEYQVTDPVKAVSEVKDFADTLYRALQHAFRKTLGAITLDQILEKKVTVDEEVAAKIKAEMALIGIEVGDITLKDVILPGEMRDILNMVVTAEKEAEANVIRRREETNATRSLLNTAKVMAENPVMLRLKELEALEVIASKVERLTVHSGTDGLMNDLVRLRDN